MGRTGVWLLLAVVLGLANVAWFAWRGSPAREAGITPSPPPVPTTPAPARAGCTPPDAPADAGPTPAAPLPPVPSSPRPAVATDLARAGGAADGDPPAGLLLPVAGVDPARVTDTFDDARGSERRHEALDIMAPAGTPVLAVADGTIEKLFTSERGGLTIYQFEPTGTYAYYYAHLQAYAPGIVEGQPVRRGDVLGTVGSTGNADPAAPHLHFAVFRLTPEKQWWTGEPINPYPLLQRPAPATP